MSDIVLSAGIRQNLLSLQQTAQLMQTTQERLATGKKVNSALDNPISFFTSQALNTRSSELSALLDSMSNGIQTIQAANNGISAITSTVQSMQSTLNQALQDTSWQSASYTAPTSLTGTVHTLTFSGGAISSGPVSVNLNSITTAGTQSALSTSSDYVAPANAKAASYSGGAYTALTGAQVYSFTFNGQTISLTSATSGSQSGDTLQHAVDSINAQLAADFGAGAYTVAKNAALNGFMITGKADGSNDINVSNQTIATQGQVAGTAYTGLGAGETYTFTINGTAINLTNGSTGTQAGNNVANAVASINAQLTAANVTNVSAVVNGAGGITIKGALDGSNLITVDNQAAAGGSATTTGLGLGTTTNTGTTNVAAGANSGMGWGITADTSLGQLAQSYNFTVNGDAVTIAAGTGLASAVSSIQSQLSAAGSKFTATTNGNKLEIQEITAGGTKLTIGGTDATALFGATLTNQGTAGGTASTYTVDQLVASINSNTSLNTAIKASNNNGSLQITNLSTSDLSVVGASSTALTGGTGTANTQTIAGNSVRKGLVTQFNTLRDQLDKLATDASYNGVDLLNGDAMKLALNETGTSTITVQTTDSSGAALTINSANLGINSATNADFQSNTTINTMLDALTTSLTTLNSQSSALGSNLSAVQTRQSFTNDMINTLQTGADNLVLADTNQEGANMLALQTRQSLATSSLSLAAQSANAVLQLFQ